MNDSSHSRHRSRQSSFGGVTSVQKTTTGHTETTRANAVKPLAVRRPPTITPRPHTGKQQTRRSTLTASRPLNRARQAERQRKQPDRTRKQVGVTNPRTYVNIYDIANKRNKKKIILIFVRVEETNHPPNVNKTSTKAVHTERGCSLNRG